jgi:hypothetical protein
MGKVAMTNPVSGTGKGGVEGPEDKLPARGGFIDTFTGAKI